MNVTNKSGSGRMGFGVVGGHGIEFGLEKNKVLQGVMVNAPTTPSAQLTGAGNGSYRVDITQGIVIVDGTALEVAVAADQLLEAAGNIMASGQSKVYSIVYFKSTSDGVVRQRTFGGTPATTGSQVAPTDAEIEANFGAGTVWFAFAQVTMNRTGDTTVTQSQVNTVRPTLVPVTVHTQA